MGVELGKVLAKAILAQLNKPEDVKGHDSSVSHLPPPINRMSLCLTE
jgi:glucose-6-phosphate isomerase